MQFLRSLLDAVFLRRDRLRSYELATINALDSLVSSEVSRELQGQLADVGVVQRHAGDKEVNLYGRSQSSSPKTGFFAPFLEWPIALVKGGGSPNDLLRATIWMTNGRMFSIVFSQSPQFRATNGFSVFHKTLLLEPASHPVPLKQLSRWMPNGLDSPSDPRTVLPPLQDHVRENLLLPSAGCVPSDYETLLAKANGCFIGKWWFTGLPLREIARREGPNLFVLAESGGAELLCAIDGDAHRNAYLWNIESEQGVTLGDSFVQAASM